MSNWTPPSFVRLGDIFITCQIEKDESTGDTIETTTMVNIGTGYKKVIHKTIEETK